MLSFYFVNITLLFINKEHKEKRTWIFCNHKERLGECVYLEYFRDRVDQCQRKLDGFDETKKQLHIDFDACKKQNDELSPQKDKCDSDLIIALQNKKTLTAEKTKLKDALDKCDVENTQYKVDLGESLKYKKQPKS